MDLSSRAAYEKLLERVLSRVQSRGTDRGERTISLTPEIMHEQKQTIILNFRQLADALGREPQHLARFIFKETGRPGTLDSERATLSGRVSDEELGKLLQLYFKEFVKCPVCGGIDTKIVSEKRFRFLVCEICGAKTPIRKI
ncbi:MAG: translation initiation factor IF-2 subunit beta [Aigarchaeota archaeon]|nr:translation initiation factor IF-2 subunit beta [Candidatus Calditenuaceae archaeon]